jgi:hypothetical protein
LLIEGGKVTYGTGAKEGLMHDEYRAVRGGGQVRLASLFVWVRMR